MTWEEIKIEITKRAEVEQKLRWAFPIKTDEKTGKKLWAEIEKEDKKNTAFLKKVIQEKKHFPVEKFVGKKCEQNAWLLVQHADLDLEFQKECLALMKKDDANIKSIAYLVDRIIVNTALKNGENNKKAVQNQEYFTQWRNNYYGNPILPDVDWKKIFEKRRKIGLSDRLFPPKVLEVLEKQKIIQKEKNS